MREVAYGMSWEEGALFLKPPKDLALGVASRNYALV